MDKRGIGRALSAAALILGLIAVFKIIFAPLFGGAQYPWAPAAAKSCVALVALSVPLVAYRRPKPVPAILSFVAAVLVVAMSAALYNPLLVPAGALAGVAGIFFAIA